MKQEGRVWLCPTSAGNRCVEEGTQTAVDMCMSVTDHESTVSTDLRVTNTFQQVGEFIKTESGICEQEH